ncbi:hypothetical protein NQ314_004400 [Rhamnusium bicolor]|uniref:Uncharacterized protein n=1 Tax=Rhamnusium bicolor TaxID=1586634 RepID=A0AAV8ZIZ3_9CUCU|nr:hypothetical protein NQ314_004400 [Rhamnusium bicolor]
MVSYSLIKCNNPNTTILSFSIGFPTCYIPPLPNSLCRYNTCGLSKCTATTIEDRVHTVECNSNCKGGNPVKTFTLHKCLVRWLNQKPCRLCSII